MSLWNNLIEKATGVRVRNGFERVPLTVNVTHAERPDYQSYMTEYELRLTIAATYRVSDRTTDEAHQRAREQALLHLRTALYGDLLGLQTELMHAIVDGDQDQARTLCAKLRSEILG